MCVLYLVSIVLESKIEYLETLVIVASPGVVLLCFLCTEAQQHELFIAYCLVG